MSIVKAQGKLLQTPKTLNLQQCLTVCRHYESLKLHIEQIRPGKSVDYLRKCHNKSSMSTCYEAALPNCFVNQTSLYIFIYCVPKSCQVQKILITMKENIITFTSMHNIFFFHNT